MKAMTTKSNQEGAIGVAFQPAGSSDFPVRCPDRATGKSPAPTDKNVRHASEGFSRITFWFGLLSTAFCLTVWADYSIDSSKIAGGGGTSSGGQYSVSGTVGQADASGEMAGGPYSVTGGFWASVQVVQTPGAPTLSINRAGTAVRVYWPDVAGWSLQQNTDLQAPAGWTASEGITLSNGTNSLTVPNPAGNLFFRLKHP